jgi:hypothetical protein
MTKSRRMRWAGHIEHMGVLQGVYRVLVEKSESKKSLEFYVYSLSPFSRLSVAVSPVIFLPFLDHL